jgi:hypothetical protein
MKINKFTSALAGLGIISLAGVAHATNPVILFTGSTAARSFVNAGLAASMAIVSPAPNNSLSGQYIVFEGTIDGQTVDIDCDWSGSEAGIAAVANQPLYQLLPSNPNSPGPGPGGSWPIPNVPAQYLTQSSGWTALATPAGASDLAMADTSQAVSLTPASLFPLQNYQISDFGIVGIIPFTWMKGYQSTPNSTWSNVVDVTTALANQNLQLGDAINASQYTGKAADNTVGIGVFGRNQASGTHQNSLISAGLLQTTPISQVAWGTAAQIYPAATPGTLTFAGSFASGQNLFEIGNDGFDSGSGVQKSLNVDGSGSPNGVAVFLGYLGMSDAKNAFNASSGGGAATYLPYNGVYEGDQNIIQGKYSFWGQEHMYGQQNPSTLVSAAAAFILNALATELATSGAATGDVSSNPTGQSFVIPAGLMQVHKTSDTSYPITGPY